MTTRKLILAALLCAALGVMPLCAQTGPVANGPLAQIPAVCTVGQIYFATNATAGQNLYFCTATNTWAQMSGGVSSGTATQIPAVCAVGQIYFATNATAGQNLYFCTAANMWTQMSGGGGSNSLTCYAQTINASSLGSGQTQSVSLNGSVPYGSRVVYPLIYEGTSSGATTFSGAGGSYTLTVSLGTSGNTTAYTGPVALAQSSPSPYSDAGANVPVIWGATPVASFVTTATNLSAWTSGSVQVSYCVLPAASGWN